MKCLQHLHKSDYPLNFALNKLFFFFTLYYPGKYLLVDLNNTFQLF